MTYNVFSINIRDFFGREDSMKSLQNYIESFSCPRNPSIERFLKRSAINFTKQDTSVTYFRQANIYNAAAYLIAQRGKNYTYRAVKQ